MIIAFRQWLMTMAALIVLAAPVVTPAHGQGLADPTRPPASLADPSAMVEPGGPVLQSVMLSPTRKVAVISGEMVLLGGKYGDARLVKLTETEAVLRSGKETTVLRLYPQVVKRDKQGTGTAVVPPMQNRISR